MKRSYRKLRIYWKKLLRSQHSSHDIAWGVSLGIFVSVTTPPGTHILIALSLAFLFRVNKIAAALGTLFSNPLTFGPIYYGALQMGLTLFNMDVGQMRRDFLADIMDASDIHDFWQNFLDYGQDLFWPMISGLMILGLVSAVFGYFITRISVDWIRAKKN